jgi:hypothetical protein
VPGLVWLLQGSRQRGLPGCMTFVRGTDERLVLAGLGVDPDDAIRPDFPEFSSTPGITIVRSGDWLVALEDAAWPRGIRPDVPDRLRPLAEELGMSHQDGSRSDPDYDLGDLEILLLIAETAFGLSLDEAGLSSPLLKVPDQPADPTPRPPASHTPRLVSSAQLRPHVQRLLDSGLTAEAIAAHTGLQFSANGINNLLRGANFWIPARTAGQIFAIEVPPNA